jgi:exopolysaccharide production protein ExoQ
VRVHNIVERLVSSFVLLLSSVFIVMSGSRTGWIAAALAIALTFGFRALSQMASMDRIFILLALVAPLAAGVLIAGTYSNQILALLDKDPTLTQRTIIWAQVIPSILKHPLLGYGYSAFWAGLNGESAQTILTTGWMEGQAQDGYLDVLLQLGVLGLVPTVLLFLRAFGKGAKLIERRLADRHVLMSIVLLLVVLIENVGESSLLLPLNLGWFYALIALFLLGTTSSRVEAF